MAEYDGDITSPMTDGDYECMAKAWAARATHMVRLVDYDELHALAWHAIALGVRDWRPDGGASLRGWLSKFAQKRYWRLAKQLAQSRRRGRYDIRVIPESGFCPDDETFRLFDHLPSTREHGSADLERDDELDVLSECLNSRQKRIFRMMREGMTLAEIGSAIGCGSQNVCDQWHRAMIPRLRKAKISLDNHGKMVGRVAECV